MLDEKTLRKNIRELFDAGWTNGKIADTLAGPHSFGDEFSREEILEIANAELKIMNEKIRKENIEVNKAMTEAINTTLLRNPSMVKDLARILKDI